MTPEPRASDPSPGPDASPGIEALSSRLLRALASAQAGNVLFSPCSLAFCLAIVLNGAAGHTWTLLATALGMGSANEPEVNRALHGLRARLAEAGPSLDLRLASAVWWTPGAGIDPAFVRRVGRFYAAEAARLEEPGQAAADTVNRWAADHTGGRITALIGPDDVTAASTCVLTDAVYFSGRWTEPFPPEATRLGPFTTAGGTPRDVSMMTRSGPFAYTETGEFQAVALDYTGGELTMCIVLPAPDAAPAEIRWSELLAGMRPTQVVLTLPRFSVACELDLVPALAGIGLGAAFAPGADFSRMGPAGSFVSAWRHAARIEIREEGTEAAAGTAVVMGRSLHRPVPMVVDRPFLCSIVDRRSGLLLFLGRITDPGPAPTERA